MNRLLNLIATHRFESNDDLGFMALEATRRYQQRMVPLLEKAFPNVDEYDQISYEVSRYVASVEISAYLDGIRDGVGLFSFHGTRDEAMGDGYVG